MRSLSLAIPVLVPQTPVTDEIGSEVGSEWISTYSTALGSDVLAQGAAWIKHRNPGEPGPDLSQYNWEGFADGLTSAYQQAIETP